MSLVSGVICAGRHLTSSWHAALCYVAALTPVLKTSSQPSKITSALVCFFQLDLAVVIRRGEDLVMSMELQLVEALCGFKKPVQTLDNRTLLITSHPGKPNH